MRLSFWFCFWSAAVGDNSQFGVFNSLLGRREFPACAARELAREGLICFTVFVARRGVCEENRRNSRVDGKNWEFVPTGADPSDCVHRSIGDCRSSAIVNDPGLSLGSVRPPAAIQAGSRGETAEPDWCRDWRLGGSCRPHR